MTLLQLNYLVAVAESGSINKAAGRLFISQSGMSAAIRELERELGITIFRRTSRGASFTDEGFLFYQQIRPMVEQEQKILRKYTHIKRHPLNSLRISAQHYPFAVQAFTRYQARLKGGSYDLRLHEVSMDQIIEDVACGDSDLGLIFLSNATEMYIQRVLDEQELAFQPLCETLPHAYLRVRHPLAGQALLTVEQLGDYPYVYFEKVQSLAADFSEEIVLENFEPPERLITVNDRRTLYSILSCSDAFSIGSGLLPEGFCDPDIIARPIHSPSDKVRLGWIRPKGVEPSPGAKAFLQDLTDILVTLLLG